MVWTIEFYKEEDLYCAFIGDDNGGSGIGIKRGTQEELANDIAAYVNDLNDELTEFIG